MTHTDHQCEAKQRDHDEAGEDEFAQAQTAFGAVMQVTHTRVDEIPILRPGGKRDVFHGCLGAHSPCQPEADPQIGKGPPPSRESPAGCPKTTRFLACFRDTPQQALAHHAEIIHAQLKRCGLRKLALLALAILGACLSDQASAASAQSAAAVDARMMRTRMCRPRRSPSSMPATSGSRPRAAATAVRLSSPRGEEIVPEILAGRSLPGLHRRLRRQPGHLRHAGDGGLPRRITHHGAPDRVLGWYPDGKSILFASR